MPMLSSLFVVGWTCLWIYFFALLVSCGHIEQPTMGSQAKKISFTTGQWNMLFINAFMYLWIMEFIQAMFQFSILTGVCTWYFTSSQDSRGKFSLCRGLGWALSYNIGSIAFGSCVLAVVWSIRIVFEYIDSQVRKVKGKNGGCVNCILACTRCCIDCFHRFIKFLNDNAYIQMALTGDSFCMSAMQAFILALKNSGSFFITNGIGNLIQKLGVYFISIINTGIGYLVINNVP